MKKLICLMMLFCATTVADDRDDAKAARLAFTSAYQTAHQELDLWIIEIQNIMGIDEAIAYGESYWTAIDDVEESVSTGENLMLAGDLNWFIGDIPAAYNNYVLAENNYTQNIATIEELRDHLWSETLSWSTYGPSSYEDFVPVPFTPSE